MEAQAGWWSPGFIRNAPASRTFLLVPVNDCNSDPQMLLPGNPRLFYRDVAQVSPSFVCLGVPLISASTYALAL